MTVTDEQRDGGCASNQPYTEAGGDQVVPTESRRNNLSRQFLDFTNDEYQINLFRLSLNVSVIHCAHQLRFKFR
jgi:hypothetical protein